MRPVAVAWAAILVTLMALVSCANPVTVPTTPQGMIDEANINLTAAASVIRQNTVAGIYTKQEAQKYLDRLRDLSRGVDEAQALVTKGVPDAAKQAEIIRSLVLALHREVAARARGTP